MSLINESQLRSFRKSIKTYNLTLNESLKNFKSESKFLKTKIFLSHKHEELEQLEGAISFLKNHGVEVYVDWLDGGMPKTTCGETAVKLKEKIKENDKFILLATESAIKSPWCNWELGLGDAERYIHNIAIFPIKKDSTDFSGNEYLEIYPYIVQFNELKYFRGEFYASGAYVVYPSVNGNSKVIALRDWLKLK